MCIHTPPYGEIDMLGRLGAAFSKGRSNDRGR
jgi:hypothetical protein